MPTASLQRGKTPPNKYLVYDIKTSDGKALSLENVESPFIAVTPQVQSDLEW